MTCRIIAVAAALSLVILGGAASAASPSRKDVWNFTGGSDGHEPQGNVLATKDGSLYGVTSAGGTSDNGVVFRNKPYGSTDRGESTVWNFTGGNDGSTPMAGVIEDSSGALYGTASRDGAGRAGTVYRLSPPAAGQTAWTETTLWAFSGGADGGQPVSALVADQSGSGVLYGTTSFGGTSNLGTVFELSPPAAGQTSWTETVLWSFTGDDKGASPAAGLVQAADGSLFGTTLKGGAGVGTVFKLTPHNGGTSWGMGTIWTFSGGADGATPAASLVADGAGNLYGTTQFGGANYCPQANWPFYGEPNTDSDYAANAAYVTNGGNGCGVVFELSPPAQPGAAWVQTVLFTFAGDEPGCNPQSNLLLGANGVIYGTAPINDAVYPKMSPPPNLWTGDVFSLTPPTVAGNSYTASVISSFE
jgi:uncharacterized repeat protein (TIGR03803 family)